MTVGMEVVPSLVLDLSVVPSPAAEGAERSRWDHDSAMTSRAQTSTDPSSSADVVVVGRLGSRIEVRELPSGDTVTVFTMVQ